MRPWRATIARNRSRAEALAATLKVEVGAVEIGTDLVIEKVGVEERPEGPVGRTPTTFIKLRWTAARAAALMGHRIADASVHRFVADVASLLRSELGPP